jgi:hypothetical protein
LPGSSPAWAAIPLIADPFARSFHGATNTGGRLEHKDGVGLSSQIFGDLAR